MCPDSWGQWRQRSSKCSLKEQQHRWQGLPSLPRFPPSFVCLSSGLPAWKERQASWQEKKENSKRKGSSFLRRSILMQCSPSLWPGEPLFCQERVGCSSEDNCISIPDWLLTMHLDLEKILYLQLFYSSQPPPRTRVLWTVSWKCPDTKLNY